MDLSKSKITMRWADQATEPPHQPISRWSKADFSAFKPSEWEESCRRLFGIREVANILRLAFERGLNRHQKWQADIDLSASEQLALSIAARIYKRGVTYASSLPDLKHQQSKAGLSTIELFSDLQSMWNRLTPQDIVVVDKNVSSLWQNNLPANTIVTQVTESTKNLDAAAEIAARIPAGASRMVIIGGGVVGDVAGFVAGIKNLPTVYIPTTLLAMADSSVGGKTGVNAGPWGKNQLGLFHPPTEVWMWNGWLKTLPERELKSGMIECVKHALLSGDQPLWNDLVRIATTRAWSDLTDQLLKIVSVKAAIVERDPFEKGERAVLNLGHTMGHAVETLSRQVDGKNALTHGEAVAIGLCHALELSQKHTGFNDAGSYVQSLKSAGLVPSLSGDFLKNAQNLATLLKGDKKNTDSTIQWVLMSRFGNVARAANGAWTMPLPETATRLSGL